ncbi:MAG: tetratricopeptide repeat protein [Acidobacteria bacterium]|nr:tetratricopeptide repeat protein [Acidobacteriota bacterium]
MAAISAARCAARLAAIAALALAAGCSSRSTPAASRAPAPDAAASDALVQELYESGRYDEVVSRVTAASVGDVGAEALWLAAHSHLRLGRKDEAARLLARLATMEGDPGWQVTSQLALAGLEGNADALARARQAAGAFPGDPFVQYELGLSAARSGDFTAAAQAFDRSLEADPTFAYAYYYAGLTYDRLGRADLMVTRFDTFLRLAPQAPERPEVESILRTVRGR